MPNIPMFRSTDDENNRPVVRLYLGNYVLRDMDAPTVKQWVEATFQHPERVQIERITYHDRPSHS